MERWHIMGFYIKSEAARDLSMLVAICSYRNMCESQFFFFHYIAPSYVRSLISFFIYPASCQVMEREWTKKNSNAWSKIHKIRNVEEEKKFFFCTHLIPSIYTVNIARGNIVCVCKDTKKKHYFFRWENWRHEDFFIYVFVATSDTSAFEQVERFAYN